MTTGKCRNLAGTLAVALMATMLVSSGMAEAEGGVIRVDSSGITSEFPEGFRIRVHAGGDSNITSILIRLKIGQRTTVAYDYLCQGGDEPLPSEALCEDPEPGLEINGELF